MDDYHRSKSISFYLSSSTLSRPFQIVRVAPELRVGDTYTNLVDHCHSSPINPCLKPTLQRKTLTHRGRTTVAAFSEEPLW